MLKKILFFRAHIRLNLMLIMMTFLGSLMALHSSYSYTLHILKNESMRSKNATISELTLTIDENTSLQSLAQELLENHFISNPYCFYLDAYLMDFHPPFTPGHYQLTSNLSNEEIFARLADSKEKVTFTIPDGATLLEIANQLEKEGLVESTAFLNAAQNKTYPFDFLKNIPEEVTYPLEGYLLPGTYTVCKGATAEEIIFTMLSHFKDLQGTYSTYLNHTSYSLHDLLTIASIISCETKLDEERALMAGVIYNRLNTHMYLQLSSTIEYALECSEENLSLNHLTIDSPYNTYLYAGLPPGPICCPSEASFKAALLPATHDYYYFVNDTAHEGRHIFTHTLSEHRKAKVSAHANEDKNFYE